MLTTGTNPDRWRRALIRSESRNIRAFKTDTDYHGLAEIQYWRAGSFSRPDSVEHGLEVVIDSTGVAISCSCEGGQKALECQHAAAVLRIAGLLPDAMLTTTPQQQPAA